MITGASKPFNITPASQPAYLNTVAGPSFNNTPNIPITYQPAKLIESPPATATPISSAIATTTGPATVISTSTATTISSPTVAPPATVISTATPIVTTPATVTTTPTPSETSPAINKKLRAFEQGCMELKLDSAAQKALKQQAIVEGEKELQVIKKKNENEIHEKKMDVETENLLNSELVGEIKREELKKVREEIRFNKETHDFKMSVMQQLRGVYYFIF